MSIREQVLSKKGTFAHIETSRPCKVRKGCPEIIKHTVIANARIGASYDALKSVQTSKGVSTTEEARALNTGLRGFTWVNYPHILKSDKTGKLYARIETNNNTKFHTTYTIDGKEVSRETIEPMLLASEKSRGNKPVVMNIGLDTITKFS